MLSNDSEDPADVHAFYAKLTKIIIATAILIALVKSIVDFQTEIVRERNFYKSKVGDVIQLPKSNDTVVVILFNSDTDIYTLSNGLTMNKEFIFKAKKIKR